MSISTCPRCSQQVSIPSGVSSTTTVRCPLCRERYVLADALAALPPMLEVVEEVLEPTEDLSTADWSPAAPATASAEETLEFAEPLAASESPTVEFSAEPALDFGEPVAEEILEFQEESIEEAPTVIAEGDDAIFMSDETSQVEAPGFATSEPVVREMSADHDPLEVASIDDQTMFEFEQRKSDEDKIPPLVSEEVPLELEFDDAPASGEAASSDTTIEFAPPEREASGEEELELNFDEFAPAEDSQPGEAATIEFSAMSGAAEGEDAGEIDFGELDAGAEPAETTALGFVRDPGEPPAEGEEIGLDFGEPVAESEPVAFEEEPEADGKKKKKAKKAKKEKKPKVVDESGEEVPRKRGLVGTLVSVMLGALVAIPLSLYGIMWMGPDYDFFKVGKTLASWSVPLPAAYSKPTAIRAVAMAPTTAAPVAAPGAGQPSPDQPAPAESAPANPEGATEPNQPAPAEPATTEPVAADPNATPPSVTETAASPTEPSASPAKPEEMPAEQPKPEPVAETPSTIEPATAATEPAPAATEPPAEAAPAKEESLPPAETIADTRPASPAAAEEMPTDEPAHEQTPADAPPKVEPRVAAKPTEEELPLPDLDAPTKPAAATIPSADDRPELGDEPAAPADVDLLGPAEAPEFVTADLGKVMQTAGAAEARLIAAQSAKDEAAIKTARSQFYVSLFRLAEVVTFAKDVTGSGRLEADRAAIEKIMTQFASDRKRLDALKFNAARWLTFSKRTTPGIALAGTVVGSEAVGKLHQVRVNVGLNSEEPVVAIVNKAAPPLNPGDQVFVLGSIVERPGERLFGYDGDEPVAVWSGMTLKLSAEK